MKRIFLVWVLLMFGVSGSLQAKDMETCKTFQNNAERLKCYDSISGFVGISKQENRPSLWMFNEDRDEFSNKNTSMVFLFSDAVDQSLSDKPSTLYVRCDGNGGVDIFVVANGYIGARNNSVPVRYKFGSSDPISERWSESTNGNAAFLPSGFRDFRAGLQSGEDFHFEITDFRGSKHRAKFENSIPDGDKEKFVFGGCL